MALFKWTRLLIVFAILFVNDKVSAVSSESEEHRFGLNDIPLIKNQKPLTIVLEKGFAKIFKNMITSFETKTKIKINVVEMELGDMYSIQQASLEKGKGAYDLLSIESGWAKEWAANGFTVPIQDLAKEIDPVGIKGMTTYLNHYYDALLNILSYRGQAHAIPYQTYNMGTHFRRDLFEDAGEKEAFKKKYNRELRPAETFEHLTDLAEFFTRKKGDKLAGKVLDSPFYGVALMAGHKPHINDEFSAILWGLGGHWFQPVYKEKNSIRGFKVTTVSKEAVKAAEIYRKLLTFAPPEAIKGWAFLESANALAEGKVAMWPFAYNNLWSWSSNVEKNIPGAKIGVAQVPGNRPYTGAYAFGVAYDSKNTEAAYWFLKYIGSYEGQKTYALSGGNPCRKDVATDPDFALEKYRLSNGQQQANHQSLESWGIHVNEYGHFTTAAMGKIYPELMNTAYRIASTGKVDDELKKLEVTIKLLQNKYGEEPTIE